MKQIKLFWNHNEFELQEEVNKFLRETQEIRLTEISDIRYNTYVDEKGRTRWTAMVVYES